MFSSFKVVIKTILILVMSNLSFAQGNGINLSFNNADIESVVSAIARATNKSIIIDPKVKGTISLISKQPLTADQAIEQLATTLRLNGYALVDTPSGYRIVTEADAKLQSSETYTARNNMVGDQIITRVFKLNFESAANVVALIRPLVSPNNPINALPGNNSILITDYASNINRIEKIIQSVDSPANTKVETIYLKNAQAMDVAGLINKIMENTTPQGGDLLSKLTVMADPRTNVLMIRGGNSERIAQIRSLVSRLDVVQNSGNIWVVRLKNAEATKLAITLRALMAADSSFANPTNMGGPAMTANNMPPLQPVASPLNNFANNMNQLGGATSAAATSALTGSSAPSTGGLIQADPTTNSLIITASEPVYKNLLKVIEQLDRRRAQIYIESMIVELTATNAAELGVQWQSLNSSNSSFAGTNFNGPAGSGNTNIFGSSAAINSALGPAVVGAAAPALGLGLNIGTITNFGSNLAFSSLLRALSTTTGTNVLSTPNLMTLDNEEARIVVGQNIPIVTGSYAQTGSSTSVTPFQTYTRQDVGITLRVRPQVSENGTVKLQIFQEVSSIQDVTNVTGIILNKRNVESNVIVDDGQIIVLAGLIGDNYTDNSSKIPLLGDIPLIGGLFRYDNKTRQKTNLMVFIRPSVLRSNDQNNDLSNRKLDDLDSKRKAFVQVPMLFQKEALNDKNLRDILSDVAP